MSIVLKTDTSTEVVQRLLEHYKKCGSSLLIETYAALLAERDSMQMAIEEAKEEFYELDVRPETLIQWIEQRAAANLARLMGEGK